MRGKKVAVQITAAICICSMAASGWNRKVQAAETVEGSQSQEEGGEISQFQEEEGDDSQSQGEEGDDSQSQEDGWPVQPEIGGEYAIVMEANSGAILYEKNIYEQKYPASITKIMTAILAIENGDFKDEVVFSADAVYKTEGSGIWRDVDEVMNLEQCMYALMLASANECAYAIAEHVGGTYENFIDMMNEKAAELGCTGTHFNNPHGLPDEEHYTTCYDMALIASYAIQDTVFQQIAGTVRYDIPPTNKHDEITYLTNHHKMLKQSEAYYDEFCIGGKTGYTLEAGNTLVTYAQKNGMTLVCVVMQEKTPGHYEDTRFLLDWCFEHFRGYNVSENVDAETVAQPSCDYLEEEDFARFDKDATIVLPVGVSLSELHRELISQEASSQIVGTLQFTYGERVVGKADVICAMKAPTIFPFQGSLESSQEPVIEQKEEKKYSIKPWLIVGIVLGVTALGSLGFGIYHQSRRRHR